MSTQLNVWIRELLDVGSEVTMSSGESRYPVVADSIPQLPQLHKDMNVRRAVSSRRGGGRGAGETLSPWARPSSTDASSSAPRTRHPLLTWIPADAQEPDGHFRLVYWPRGVPNGPFLGVLSSRLRRDLGSHRDWFAALREMNECLSPDTILVTAQSTTPFPFLQRLSAQEGRRTVTLCLPSQERSTAPQWWRRLNSIELPGSSELYPAAISPLLPVPAGHFSTELATVFASSGMTAANCSHSNPSVSRPTAPLADRAVSRLADQLIVLRLRKQGRLLPWLQALLARPPLPYPIWLAVGSDLVVPSEAEHLVRLGGCWWRSFRKPSRSSDHYAPVSGDSSTRNTIRLAGQPDKFHPLPVPPWTYLTHCTRRQDGPWPDETEEHYWDDLLWDRPGGDHSALEALRRILSTRRLLGSSRGIRGGSRVVCWTEVPLPRLAELHVYRPHRVRWDFCPYGICIQREWLEQQGARPVLYAPPSQWSELSDQDRPFFQSQTKPPPPPLAGYRDIQATPKYDWRSEREWRILGDLDLRDLPAELAYVFVPTIREAEILASGTLWPVYKTP